MKTKQESPALHCILHFNRNQGYQQGQSRERWHDGVRSAVRLAISFGLRFDVDDFKTLATPKTKSYHDTMTYCADEYDYAIACGIERGRANPSAAQSYEQYRNRKPFLIADKDCTTPTRVYVGREFSWQGLDVKCTSFSGNGSAFIACTYKPQVANEYERKIDRRIRISHDLLLRQRRDSVKVAAMVESIKKQISTLPADVVERLQEATEGKFGCVPIPQLTVDQLVWIEGKMLSLIEPSVAPVIPASAEAGAGQ